MPPSDCFGTGREHKLDLLCGLFGVLDCKWMSGPAGSRDHQPRGTCAQTEIPAKSIARSHERAKECCAFLLTKTYMDAGNTSRTANSSATAIAWLLAQKPWIVLNAVIPVVYEGASAGVASVLLDSSPGFS